MKKNLRTISKALATWSLALTVSLASLTILATGVKAHEGMEHINGTITALGDKVISVKDTKGKMVDVHVDAKTEYSQGKAAATFGDLKVGEKVAVHAMEMNGSMVAHEVELPAKPKAKK